MRSLAIIAIALGTFTLALRAQRPSARQIDGYFRSEMRRQQIPGIALAILKNGRTELLRTYGFANLEHRVPVKPNTVFQSGSNAKQFTAAAIMLLVQDGKIGLDDPVGRYLADAPSAWKDVTIRRLLDHTAGLGNFGDEVDLRRDYTEDEYWALIKSSPLKFAPGTSWDYSNLGYVTLGIVIHKVSGKFYGDLLARRIFRPLKMSATRVISEADIVPNRASGYHLVNGELKNQDWVAPSNNTTADGALYVTLEDMMKWDAALYSDFPLRKESRDTIWSRAVLSDGTEWPYGLGWHLGEIGHRRVVFHGGAWQGFKTFIGRVLNDERTFILLANSWDTHEFRMAQKLLSMYYPEIKHVDYRVAADPKPQQTAVVRRLLTQILLGTTEFSDLTSADASASFPKRVDKIRNTLRSLTIPIAVIDTSEVVSTRNDRIIRYLLSDVLKSWMLTVELGPDGRVIDLDMEPA